MARPPRLRPRRAGRAPQVRGHLDGWGRGTLGQEPCLTYPARAATAAAAVATYLVRGHGVLELRFGSCRVGWVEHREENVAEGRLDIGQGGLLGGRDRLHAEKAAG